jgi:SAM-dependent methyltransferase
MTHPRITWLLDRVEGTRILDVGHARKQDVLLYGFRERNPQATVVGVDLDRETVLATRDRRTVVGDALRLPFRDNEFDAVVAGELLEHVWDAFALLRELARVSRPAGVVYITTPSAFSLNRWLRYWLLASCPHGRPAFRGFLGDVDHKVFWSPPSLFNAMDELGLEVVEATTVGLRVPFLARAVTGWGSLHAPWYPFSRLGSYLCLAGRKR